MDGYVTNIEVQYPVVTCAMLVLEALFFYSLETFNKVVMHLLSINVIKSC